MTKELQRLDHYGIEHEQGRYCMWDEADAIIRELRAANAVLTETIEERERQEKLEKQRMARERKKLLAMLTPEQRELLGV